MSKALDQLLTELRERHTAAEVRRLFVARDPATETMLRRVAWTAHIGLAEAEPMIQVWIGLEIFVDHPVLSHYEWYRGRSAF